MIRNRMNICNKCDPNRSIESNINTELESTNRNINENKHKIYNKG